MGKDQELLEAARSGNLAVVDKILAQRARRSGPLASLRRGPGANVQDSCGYTPLHHAALHGHKDIVRLLLAADASPAVLDQDGASPLHLAAWRGHSDIVRCLLAQNVNPVNIDLATKTKETALHCAAQYGYTDVVAQLLARGADPLVRNAEDDTPLDLAAQYGRLETVQHLLHVRPELVNPYRAPAALGRTYRNTPLHRASRNGHAQVVEVLLAEGVDVNIRTEAGTALHEAALLAKANVVQTLLEHGADVNITDAKRQTVDNLLKPFNAPAHRRVKDTIDSHRQSNGFDSEPDDYLPPFPVDDLSPCDKKSPRRSSSDIDDRHHSISMPNPETPKDNDHSINKNSSSALIKHHSNNLVKKITSKCLGLKAKFNSAPNISNTGLGSEVELRSKANLSSEDRAKVTNTLHIGNSRFFKILAKKKDESIDVVCNDEFDFDTISLDRLITIDRLSIHNRSNRSCPGFQASLPNISENAENSSDSSESIEGSAPSTDLHSYIPGNSDSSRVTETYNSSTSTKLPYAILEDETEDIISSSEYKEIISTTVNSRAAENDLYEPYHSVSKNKTGKQLTKNVTEDESIKPQRRKILPPKTIDTIYENVNFHKPTVPSKPPTRNVVPVEKISETVIEPIYINMPLRNDNEKPVPAKRTLVSSSSTDTSTSYESLEPSAPSFDSFSETAESTIHSSRTSTMSLDSKIDFSNFEDILMSKKSKSFRNPGQLTIKSNKSKDEDSSDTSSGGSSIVGEYHSIDDADSSDSDTVNNEYMSMSRTLPKPSVKPKPKLFRNVTFSPATSKVDGLFKKRSNGNYTNYHIRGTGHCVYNAPTVQEFIYVFNKDTLKDADNPPFLKVRNDRDSVFETAICFCRPSELKHHKSADDLAATRGDESPKVFIDAESLLKRIAVSASSFRCYCDDGFCTLHHRSRGAAFSVKFHAFHKSISTPNLARIDSAERVRLEDPYAVVDLSSVRFRQDSTSSNDTSLTFGALSEPSATLSLRRPGSAGPADDGTLSSSCGTLRGSVCGLSVASLDGGSRAAGCVRSGSRRWDEGDVLSEADALSVSSAASSSLPHHLHHHHHHGHSKVSPTPPKKPPRRNLSVSPTHVNSPAVSYDQLRTHARSQDDLDELQGAKHYLKHGRSVDQYVDKHSYAECEENHNSPRLIPVPNPRPSLKHRNQPVAITATYENVVIKEQNPRRKLRRNFTHQYENFEPARMLENSQRKYSTQERSSVESLLDVQSINSPSDCERYEGVRIPLSPTHYDQPPTPDHPPPSARHAENSIHERIRPLSQEYKRRSYALRDSQTETESNLLRAASAASVASGATDRSTNTDNCVEEYICDVPFAGLFKGSTTTLDGIGLRPVPAERPKTLRKLKSVYDSSPTEPVANVLGSNGHERDEDVVRRRSNTTSSNHSADKSLSILSPFDEQEEWAKISEIMASFGSKLVRESVFVSELEQEFTSRLGLSCSESSLSSSVISSVGHWLNGLGMADYESLFIESGFDEVDFINGVMDENDLREMGIEETDRAKIIEAVKQLPLKIAEISTNHNNIYNNNNVSKPNDQIESVEEWLKNISLEQYSDTFRKHLYVDMDRVRRIWEVELTAVLEIHKPGHRKRILASVSGQQNGPANNMDDINADLKTLKSNIQQLKQEIKEKLPENTPAKPSPHPNLAAPGGETLKRSKKNRPAPQPPKPSDLEIRAPSELMVGVPGALKTQWRHQPFVLVSGAVTYVANYLGSTVVKELRGTESTKKSIQKLKKSTKEPRDSPDIILSISYRGVKFLNTITRELVCEHEIRNIHCACQDADDLTHFAYITKDHTTKSHYCHVFCVATMDQATEVILTLGEAFEVAYQMALREQFTKNSTNRILHSNAGPQQAKTPTHDPMTTSATKEKPNMNHGRSHSITEIKLNGHQLKIAPVPASLSNEDFQLSVKSDGSRSPRTPLLKAPIASTEEL